MILAKQANEVVRQVEHISNVVFFKNYNYNVALSLDK